MTFIDEIIQKADKNLMDPSLNFPKTYFSEQDETQQIYNDNEYFNIKYKIDNLKTIYGINNQLNNF